eukprot:jgi/Picre1/29581/NNA_004966.t1
MRDPHRAPVSSRLATLSVNIDSDVDAPLGSPFLSSPTGTPKALTQNSDVSYAQASRLSHIKTALVHNRNELVLLFSRLLAHGEKTPVLLPHTLHDELKRVCEGSEHRQALETSDFMCIMKTMQEGVIIHPRIAFALRTGVGDWHYMRINVEEMIVEEMSATHYLAYKEKLVSRFSPERDLYEPFVFEWDMEPFTSHQPKITLQSSIGNGVSFLNKTLSMKVFGSNGNSMPGLFSLLEFLRNFKHNDQSLLLSPKIDNINKLKHSLLLADRILDSFSEDTPIQEVEGLEDYGFLDGWGNDVCRVRESFNLLLDLIQAPDHSTLERFLSRLPLVFRVVILSPHGFFGQNNVLGLPDTGGQVVYILDQVRALEHELQERLRMAGLQKYAPDIVVITRLIPESLGTSCNQRLEHISGTKNARILRVPFRGDDGRVLEKWMSRFEVWPYLERFTIDATREMLVELGGRPDFVIGNYSDGNMAATLMCHKLKVTQCTIAHALEKTKYDDADIYWERRSLVTRRAWASTKVISTSACQICTGWSKGLARRLTSLHDNIKELLFGDPSPSAIGKLDDPSKPILFSMARLDKVKNLTSLAEWFGRNDRLSSMVNLVIVGGVTNPGDTTDKEEQAECRKMHEIAEKFPMKGKFRWIVAQKNRVQNGEIYRFICDTKGAFVQPALYEAFGLTVIEAMTCGLPTFATKNGGPAEIIRDGKSGFHIDPHHGEESAEKMVKFFEACIKDPSYWESVSRASRERIFSRYTWDIYASRLVTLCDVYTFWNHVTSLERREAKRYLESIYILLFRSLVEKMKDRLRQLGIQHT